MPTARQARHEDVDKILGLARQAHKKSKYAGAKFDKEKCRLFISSQIGMGLPPSLGASAIFVAGDEKIEAALAAYCSPLYGCLGALLITDTFWFAAAGASPKAGIAALRAFHSWAHQCAGPYVIRQGVTDFIASDPRRAGRLLERQGMKRCGLIFEKENLG